MPVLGTTADPRPSTKPEPLGNAPLITLVSTCMLCAVFLLWRRASELRGVVAYQLTSWPQSNGRIRLSLDEGPSAREFLDDDYDDDNERLGDDEPLVVTAERLRQAVPPAEGDLQIEQPAAVVFDAEPADSPPPPPPKS
ncbi:hypothetical protein BD413DRAFT_663195 [Trametes elegans]|nr:hypothetical protein BD413DRAFT_663195 [Trametes elegans]